MRILKPKIEDYPGRLIELKSDKTDLDFAEAKDLAKQRAEEICADRCCFPGTRAKPASRIRIWSADPGISRPGLSMPNQGVGT